MADWWREAMPTLQQVVITSLIKVSPRHDFGPAPKANAGLGSSTTSAVL